MQTVVGVLQGGSLRQRDVSMATGGNVLEHLPEERFDVRPLYVDAAGQWHDRGRVIDPQRVLRQLDAVLVGTHDAEGSVQEIIERFGTPHTGSGSFATRLASHALIARTHAQDEGINVPAFHFIEHPEESARAVQDIVRTFEQPVVVKPVNRRGAGDTVRAGGYIDILKAVQDIFSTGATGILVEEYLRGKAVRIGVIEKLREEPFYTLPVVELASTGEPQTVPARIPRADTEELARLARTMHRVLGLRHISESDFMLTSKGLYYLGTDVLPPLAPDKSMARALAAVGVPLSDFYAHLVKLALSR